MCGTVTPGTTVTRRNAGVVLVPLPKERDLRGTVLKVVRTMGSHHLQTPVLTLLESRWLHRHGKPEVRREAVIDKLRIYQELGPPQEELDGDELTLIDADEDATDPKVDTEELLGQIDYLHCCHVRTRTQKKARKTNLVKDVGEGDWGKESDHNEENPAGDGPDEGETPADMPDADAPLGSNPDPRAQIQARPTEDLPDDPVAGPSNRPKSAADLPPISEPRCPRAL